MYIIDGYNAVHAGRLMGGALANLSVFKLCQWIAASPKRVKVTLVLDGRRKPDEPGENEFPEIELVYSGTGVPADVVIAAMVEKGWESRRNRKSVKLCVVSNDRAVAVHAKKNHARAIGCEAFLEMLVMGSGGKKKNALPARKTGAEMSVGETEHWMREFGFTPPAKKSKKSPPSADIDIEKLMGGG